MTEPDRRLLWKRVLRQTGRDPSRVGYWLRRQRRAEGLGPAGLARVLGIDVEKLVLLSLCLTPRDDHFREDLGVVCRRTGADPAALALLLRQQQALERWAERAPSSRGWLAAASDAAPPDDEDETPTPPGDVAP